MLRVIVFNLLLLTTSGYAVLRGGAPERMTGWLLIAAAAMTWIVPPWHVSYFDPEAGIFAIDVLLLLALVVIALKADRFWPLVMAAMQLDSIAAHILKVFDADLIPITYALMITVWAYPMQFILVAGTIRHRSRLQRFGADRSWSIPQTH
jgi:hypothetical protein